MLNSLVNYYILIYFNILPLIAILLLLFAVSQIINNKNRLIMIIIASLLIYSFIPYCFAQKSNALAKDKNFDAAIKTQALAAKLTINPLSKNMFYNTLACWYFRVNDISSAKEARKKATKLINTQNIATTLILSKYYTNNKDYNETRRILLERSYVETNPVDKMAIYSLLSDIYIEAKAYPLAFETINNYVAIYNANSAYYRSPAPCKMIKKRLEVAKILNKKDITEKDRIYLTQFCKGY